LHIDVQGQARACPKRCPKNGDVPKSPFLQVAALVPSAGDFTLKNLSCFVCGYRPRPRSVRPRDVGAGPESFKQSKENTMNRRHILSLSVMTTLGIAVLPGSAVAQEKSLKEQLVGTWTVTSWNQDVASGPQFQRFGANPNGVHVFDANGRYVVMIAHPDLPKIASNNPSTPTPEELKGLLGRSIAYYGTYTVDEGAKIVTLKVEASSFPNQVGVDQKRTVVSISPTELKYQNTTPVSAGQIHYVFKRAPAVGTN
jgi:hypothetical protein